jgi:hypothetical protein
MARIYLVAEAVELIAEDLADCLREADPGARVVIAAPRPGFAGRLPPGIAAAAAFLHLDPNDPAVAADLAQLRASGARLWFMGASAEMRGGPEVLDRPFSTETVAAALRGDADAPGVLPGACCGA